jgi:hypothetical protein
MTLARPASLGVPPPSPRRRGEAIPDEPWMDMLLDRLRADLLPPGFVTFEEDEAEQMEEAHP